MATIKKPLVISNGNIEEAGQTDLVESAVGLPTTTIGDTLSVTASDTQLTATSYTLVTPVRIQADPENTSNVKVKYNNTPGTGSPVQIGELVAGYFRILDEINEPRKVYLQSVSGTQTVYWSAGT